MVMWQELIAYYGQNYDYIWSQFVQHFLMAGYGVLFAAIVAIPLGIYMARKKVLSSIVFSITNVIQTIPALALLSVLLLFFGLGANTVVIALFLYSLLPILRNTYTGIKNVDEVLLENGTAMGMTKRQVLWMVQLPLSLSVILAGLRTALVVAIGITAIGTFIGAGGLGDIIVRGTNASDGMSIVLAGAIPTALMAVMADIVLGGLERKFSPVKRLQAGQAGR
ncbi:ABC transporter permease [Bacillus sp. FSL W7-1360]